MIQCSSHINLSLLQTSCLNLFSGSPPSSATWSFKWYNAHLNLSLQQPFLLNYIPQDHHCVQPRPDSGCVRRMFHSSLPAHWRPCKVRHLTLCIWKIVPLLEHQILSLYPLSIIQKPFCVSVSPLWRLQRQKGLKLVRLTGELGSVTQFHIAKLAHPFPDKMFDLQRIMISSTHSLPHLSPSLVQAYWGLQLQKEAALRNATGLNRLLKIQVSKVRKRFWNVCRVFCAPIICSYVKE